MGDLPSPFFFARHHPMTASTPAPATKTKPRLSAKEWARIEALWEEGDITYAELVRRFGTSISTFERRFKKRGIVKGAKAAAQRAKVEEELKKQAVDEAVILAGRIKETKEEHYKMAAALGRLTWNEILQAKRDSKPVSVALNNLKSLHAAMAILKAAREERYAVLGLDRDDAVDPDQLPELIITELTPEQAKALRDRDHTEVEDGPITQATGEAVPLGDIDDDADPDEVVEEGEAE